MKSVTVDSWQKLCEEAVHEKDPKRLLELMLEIDRLLEEKEQRLLKIDAAAMQRGTA